MQRINIAIAFLFISHSLLAQFNIRESHPLNGVKHIKGDFEWSDITVKSYAGSDLLIEGELSVNLGENNDAHQLLVSREGDVLEIKSGIKDLKALPRYLTIYKGGEEIYIKIKDRKEVDWKEIRTLYGVDASERCSIGALIDIKLTLFVPAGPELSIETKYGSIEMIECVNKMSLKSTYGSLIAALPSRPVAEASFKSTYGFVDLSVPDGSGFDLTAHTNHGEIYSNLNWGIDPKRSIHEVYNSRIVGLVNSGGNKVSVEALYDNVYLRKKI